MALSASLLQGMVPGRVSDYANQAADVQNQQMQATQQQTAFPLAYQQAQIQLQGGQQDLANKRRGMAISLLNGLNGLDPEKQAALYPNLKSMANRVDPTIQFPDQFDPDMLRALTQSQIPAEKQAEFQNDLQKAQILAGAKGMVVSKDALGNPILVNKLTGETSQINGSPLTPGSGSTPSAPQQPAFGFSLSGINPMELKKQTETDAKRMQAFQNNRQRAANALEILDAIEPNLNNFKTGTGGDARMALDKAGSMLPDALGGSYFEGPANAANNIDKDTNDLVTQLQGFQYVPGQRAGVLGLKTLIASKPGLAQQPETNRNIIAGLRTRLNDYNLSEEVAQAYKEASPLHVIDSNADKIDEALKTIYPLQTIDPKTGRVTFNPDNVEKIRSVIPEALANPNKYLEQAMKSKGGAAQQASAMLKQAPQGTPNPYAGAKQAPDGNYYVPDPQRPGKYLMVKQ